MQIKPKHAPHHHGIHLLPKHIKEMEAAGVSKNICEKIVEKFRNDLGHYFDLGINGDAIQDAEYLVEQARQSENAIINKLRTEKNLVAGEMPPHLLDFFLANNVKLTQIHDPTPHGEYPPHFRHLNYRYPLEFKGLLSFRDLASETFDNLLIDGYKTHRTQDCLVSPLALVATQIWQNTEIVLLASDHRAPHHLVTLERIINHCIFGG